MRIYLINLITLSLVFSSSVFASVNEGFIDRLIMKQSELKYHKTNEKGLHQILLSSPKRINNEILIEKDVRERGALHLLMTGLPVGKNLTDGYDYYRSIIGDNGELLYKCAQRSCGVSSYWANDILGDRDLSGRDSDQYYVAGKIEHGGYTYLMSVYLVSNTLRQNLAFISIIKQSDSHSYWRNGLYLPAGGELPLPSLIFIREQLAKDNELNLYIANYTNKLKFRSIHAMEAISIESFLKVQAKLSSDLSVDISRIKPHFVGSFHEQVIEGSGDSWSRLFLFKP